MALTRAQLEVAANDAFYLVHQMFAFYSWTTRVKPRLSDLPTPLHATIVENAVVEAQLMFYRKLNEFFRRPNHRFPDDLKSELFGYSATGGFLSDADIGELHKRIAHPTTRQAEHGARSYEVYDASHAALNHSLPFLRHLATNFHSQGSEKSRSLLAAIDIIRRMWDEWSAQVEASKRKSLNAKL